MKKIIAGIVLGLSLAAASIDAGPGSSRSQDTTGEDLSLNVDSNVFNTPGEETPARVLSLHQAIDSNNLDAVVAALQRGEDPFFPNDLLEYAFSKRFYSNNNSSSSAQISGFCSGDIISLLARAQCEGTCFPLAYVALLAIEHNRLDVLRGFFKDKDFDQLNGEVLSICTPYSTQKSTGYFSHSSDKVRVAVRGREVFHIELRDHNNSFVGSRGDMTLADFALLRQRGKVFTFLTEDRGMTFSLAEKLFFMGIGDYYRACIARERKERASQTPQ